MEEKENEEKVKEKARRRIDFFLQPIPSALMLIKGL